MISTQELLNDLTASCKTKEIFFEMNVHKLFDILKNDILAYEDNSSPIKKMIDEDYRLIHSCENVMDDDNVEKLLIRCGNMLYDNVEGIDLYEIRKVLMALIVHPFVITKYINEYNRKEID